MCRAHWRLVPRDLQRDVWATYQRGQERGEHRPTKAWHEAADAAIAAVAEREARNEQLTLGGTGGA